MMKYIIALLAILSLGSISYGYFFEPENAQKFIGFGVLGVFFLVIPLFSYYRWKGKDVKDYMLTKESLKKMRENENQL